MRILRSRALAAVCLAVIGLTAPPALAQADADRATARSLGGDGQQALENKDYRTAEDRFRRADNLVHAPTLMLGLARALAGQGKYVESQETYHRIVREGIAPGAPEAFKRALADAKKEVDTVASKIGGVTITVHAPGGAEQPNAKVVLDGSPVNTASLGVRRSVDPGSHVLQVSADGMKPAEVRFDVPPGGAVDEPVTLEVDRSAPSPLAPASVPATAPSEQTSVSPGAEPPSSAPSTSSRGGSGTVLPWVAFGIGGAGLAAGAVTGFLAMQKHSDLANKCDRAACQLAQQGDLDSYHTIATISTAGFIVGGVGVVAGVVLMLTRPKPETVPPPQIGLRVVPVIGLGSIGAVGAF
jgi:hypothetical protein